MKQGVKQFGVCRLDASNQCLWRDGVLLSVAPKPFAVLQYLVEHPDRLVTHDELLDALWPETYVQPQVLRTYVLDLRKLLRDDAADPKYIATLPKRGYRFLPPVTDVADIAAKSPANSTAETLLRSARGAGEASEPCLGSAWQPSGGEA